MFKELSITLSLLLAVCCKFAANLQHKLLQVSSHICRSFNSDDSRKLPARFPYLEIQCSSDLQLQGKTFAVSIVAANMKSSKSLNAIFFSLFAEYCSIVCCKVAVMHAAYLQGCLFC